MVEVNTVLDKGALMKLNLFHLFKKNKLTLLLPMVIFIMLGLFISIFHKEESDKYFGIIFTIVFGLGFPLLCLGMMKFMIWLQLRSSKFISEETKIHYRFDDNIIYYQMKKPGMITTSEWDWSLCYKAYETKEYYYIYISNMQAHIIPKKDITAGTTTDLSELLHKSISKFKQYK